MKNKTNLFFKKIKTFFTSKNNQTVKTRRMLYGILISFTAIAAVVATLLVSTGSVGAAFRNADYSGTVVSKGEKVHFHDGNQLLKNYNSKSYSMHVEEYKDGKKQSYYIYTQTVDGKNVTCALYDSITDATYKSVSKDGKIKYSTDAKNKDLHDQTHIRGNVESHTFDAAFVGYISTGKLSCFTYANRTFFISNSLLDETVYICSNKGSEQLEYAEIRLENKTYKYTFEFK